MRKLLIIPAVLMSVMLCSCGETRGIPGDESPAPFKEVEKVEMEVSDYVEEATPAPSSASPEVKGTETKSALGNEGDKTPASSQSPAPAKTADTPKPAEKTAPAVPSQKAKKANAVQTAKPKAPAAPKESTPKNTPAPKPAPVPEPPFEPIRLDGKIICLDPGHGNIGEASSEPIAPGLTEEKPAFKEGIRGSMITEDEVNLAVALLLKEKLEAAGAEVIMTRTGDTTELTNIGRTQFANDNNADISIKLHADGTGTKGSGMSVIYPSGTYIADNNLLINSRNLSRFTLESVCKKTGAKNGGAKETSQMTGFNWSRIPVIIFEMGYLTNPQDEKKLADPSYRDLIAEGLCEGIMRYYK